MSKHTPGPWHCWTYTDCDGDPRADGVAYEVHCFSIHEPTEPYNGHELGSGEEARANARLIAAAPDLLEALKRMHAAFNAKKPIPTAEGNALEAMCRAVIGKAEGLDDGRGTGA